MKKVIFGQKKVLVDLKSSTFGGVRMEIHCKEEAIADRDPTEADLNKEPDVVIATANLDGALRLLESAAGMVRLAMSYADRGDLKADRLNEAREFVGGVLEDMKDLESFLARKELPKIASVTVVDGDERRERLKESLGKIGQAIEQIKEGRQ